MNANNTLNGSDLFSVKDIIKVTPKDGQWPTPEGNYLSASQTPYLEAILKEAKEKGITKEDMLTAWSDMLYMKSNDQFAPEFEHVALGAALHQLFFDLDYHRTKQHYAAYLELANR